MSTPTAWRVHSLSSLSLSTLVLAILRTRAAPWAALSSVWLWIERPSEAISCSDPALTAGLRRRSILSPCIPVRARARLIPLLNHPSSPPSVLHGRKGCPRLLPNVTLILLEPDLVVVLWHELNVLEAAVLAVRSLLRGDDCDGLVTAGECHIGHVCRTTSHIINQTMLRTIQNIGGLNTACRIYIMNNVHHWLQAITLAFHTIQLFVMISWNFVRAYFKIVICGDIVGRLSSHVHSLRHILITENACRLQLTCGEVMN